MAARPKIIYPRISERNLEILLKELTSQELLEELEAGNNKISVNFAHINQGRTALNLVLGHQDLGKPIGPVIIDDLAKCVGFEFNPCETLDRRYGDETKYYTFSWKDDLWVAMGYNRHENDWTRMLIKWKGKLDKNTAKQVLYEMERNEQKSEEQKRADYDD